MPVAETTYEHVVISDDLVPMIEGTTMKIADLVTENQSWGWSPEEIHINHPYLTLGQIYSALAWDWDHTDEVDQQIREQWQRAEALRTELENVALTQRLRSLKGH